MYIYLDIHTVITALLSEPPGKPHIYRYRYRYRYRYSNHSLLVLTFSSQIKGKKLTCIY